MEAAPGLEPGITDLQSVVDPRHSLHLNPFMEENYVVGSSTETEARYPRSYPEALSRAT